MIKRPPPKTTRMRTVLCGQCDQGRHDHCSKSPACECACKGSEVPPPAVTADELAHAIRVEALPSIQSSSAIPPALLVADYTQVEPHVGKYVASTASARVDRPFMPSVNTDKFPSTISVVIHHGALIVVPHDIKPTQDGITIATYDIAAIVERKSVTEVRTTTLNLDDFITAPL